MPIEVDPRYQVRATDSGYARMALSAPVLEAIAAFGQAGHRVDLSVDGEHLVAVGAPKDPEELQTYLELLGGVAKAIDLSWPSAVHHDATAAGIRVLRSSGLALDRPRRRTDRQVRPDQSWLRAQHREGDPRGERLPIEAFIHRWKTQRTETYADSNGRTQTRTVTDNHSEALTAITMPFSFPLISVGGGWGGKKVRFESEEFNDRVTVRTEDAKFASDVIHPRTMEFLMAGSRQAFGSRAM
jgi:hypothetical protein